MTLNLKEIVCAAGKEAILGAFAMGATASVFNQDRILEYSIGGAIIFATLETAYTPVRRYFNRKKEEAKKSQLGDYFIKK